MDARVKSFEREVGERFAFLADAGFCSPVFTRHEGGIRQLTATFRRAGAEVEVALTLAQGGEDTVTTQLQTLAGRQEIGYATAHTAYQMRKGLLDQAEALVDAIQTS